jgi:hypothetical protein
LEIANSLDLTTVNQRTSKADLVDQLAGHDPQKVLSTPKCDALRQVLERLEQPTSGRKRNLVERLVSMVENDASEEEPEERLAGALSLALDTPTLYEIAVERLGDRDVRRNWKAERIAAELVLYPLKRLRSVMRVEDIRTVLELADLDSAGLKKYQLFDRLCTWAGLEPLESADPDVAEPAPQGSPVSMGHRVKALLFGNQSYLDGNELSNPVKDVRDLARVLAGLGHEVVLHENLTHRQMTKAVGAFGNSLGPDDGALFYFSGHGLEHSAENWLLPTDFEADTAADLPHTAYSVQRALKHVANARFRVLILDACRHQSFRDRMRGLNSDDLRAIDLPPDDGTEGSLICYATSPGKLANDGKDGTNGLYTGALLAHLPVPGRTIEQAMKAVRKEVAAKTKGKQVPWEHSSFTGDWYPCGR